MIRRAAAFLCGTVLAASAQAVPNERIAVEVLKGETPRQAVLSFEQACYRLGVSSVDAQPVQLFSHKGASYVRLSVEGPPLVEHCLNQLPPGRRGVSGAIHWFDGFQGGEVVHGGPEEDRVPDAEWLDPNGSKLSPPAVDAALVEQLAHGDADALERFFKLDLDAALVEVHALIGQTDPNPLGTLEQIALKHPHWRVRRAAVVALNPMTSLPALLEIAKHDPAWEVRTAAVELLQPMANSQSPEAAGMIVDLMQHDPAWEVRRQALWQLSTELVENSRDALQQLVRADPEPQVRSAALEVLAGGRQLSKSEAKAALRDPAGVVRAVAANALARDMSEADAPLLWQTMHDSERIVRLAAAAFLVRITDRSIGPQLWQLYLAEADQLDADPAYERTVVDELIRAPYPELAGQVQQRLSMTLPPDERRLLSRLLARIDPPRATALLEPALESKDALTRAIAAEAAPATPHANERRRALLADADPDVRAGAVLGFCRLPSSDASVRELVRHVELTTSPLGQEATLALSRCGQPEARMPTFETALAAGAAAPTAGGDFWTAIAAIALMLVSVVAIKLANAPRRD